MIKTMRQAEEECIRDALNRCKQRPHTAAKVIGISHTTIYRKMKMYGIGLKKLGGLPSGRTGN